MIRIKEIEDILPYYLTHSKRLLVSVLDVDGSFLYVGEKFNQYFGVSLNYSDFTSFFTLLNELERSEFEYIIGEIIGKPYELFDFEQKYEQDEIRWELSVIKNSQGDFLGILAVGNLNLSQAIAIDAGFDQVDAQSDICFQIDQDWNIGYANKQASEFFGQEILKVNGQKIWDIFPQSKVYEYALEFKQARILDEIRSFESFIPEAGKWYKVFLFPKLSYMNVYLKDISERKGLSQQLELTKKTLDTVLQSHHETILLFGSDLRLAQFNLHADQGMEEFFGRKITLGEKLWQILSPEISSKLLPQIEKIFKGESISISQIDKNSNIKLHHNLIPILNDDKKTIAVLYSIRGEKDDHLRIIENADLIKEICSAQSHLLRGPLSSMLGLLELMDESKMGEENQKYFSYLKPLSLQMDQVVHQHARKVAAIQSIWER